MKDLSEVVINNRILTFIGANFIDPLFRKLTGQFPQNVRTFTIYDQDEKKIERKIKSILKKTDEPIVFVIRDDKDSLEEVLFVPSTKDLI